VVASKRASRVQVSSTSSGRQAPTATSAPSIPNSATASGATTPPSPVVATYVLSTTPNTRASTSSETSRCISVSPATSTQA
jgi:hypothetical protein